ncbi:alpha/beta hydrolase family protein [Streptomyces sp. NPDC002886]|uniref:S9 family peptidase n=1 Tax=Streptomyces sp. NPDC002886 TaxID=3364667 RepID=UPI0036C86EF5
MTSTAFVEALGAEPRPKSLAAFTGDGLLLSADVPDGAGSLVQSLVCYERTASGTCRASWSVPHATEAAAVPGGFAYVRHGGRQVVAVRSVTGGPERILHHVTGDVCALVPRPGTGELACVVRTARALGAHPDELLAGSDAVWSEGPEASLGSARRPEGEVEIWLLAVDGSAPARRIPVTAPLGASLTGEVAWAGSATLLVGVCHHLQDGTRRFGLRAVPVGAGGGPMRELLFDGIDLCYPVQEPDGQYVAYLGTVVPGDDLPPSQTACLVRSGSLELTVLDSPPDTWQRPVGWDGPGRLLCTAETGPRRRLFAYELDRAAWSDVPTAASVESVRVCDGRAAVLVSALDAPPAIDVIDLMSGHSRRVEASRLPALPGTLSYHPQVVPGIDGTLASWLCMPHRGPVRGTVVFFHGGPFKSWTEWSWRWNPWPFVADGYAVILVEPPLSLGYVPAARSGWRNWRTKVAPAAVAQVAQLRALAGLSDTPLALMGGSFGGYLSLVTAAAQQPALVVAHASPLDLAQVAQTSDVGWQWVRDHGDPTARGGHFREHSLPAHSVGAGTRVLLSHGLQDGLVPPTETLRAHRALVREGVRCEVAFFRSEAHGLSRPRNIRAWYRWVLAACAAELAGERSQTAPEELTGELAERFAELAMRGFDARV